MQKIPIAVFKKTEMIMRGNYMTYLNDAFNKKIEYELGVLRSTYLTNVSEKVTYLEIHSESEEKINTDLQYLAYQKVLQEEIAIYLMVWSGDANPNAIKAMLNTTNLIDSIYDEWIYNDYSIREGIENTIDDYIQKQKEERARRNEQDLEFFEPEGRY